MKTAIIKRIKLLLICGIVLVALYAISNFLPFIRVSGSSMEPSYTDDEIVYLNRNTDSIKRGDVVIFKQKLHFYFEEKLIKRVCGIPGDKIYKDTNNNYFAYDGIYIYYETSRIDTTCDELLASSTYMYTLSKNSYFCMGDNRDKSIDSRTFGAVDETKIIAIVKGGFKKPTPYKKGS